MAHQDIQSTYSKYNILENRKEKQGQEEKKIRNVLWGVSCHTSGSAFESRLFVLDSGAHRTRKHPRCPDETVSVL